MTRSSFGVAVSAPDVPPASADATGTLLMARGLAAGYHGHAVVNDLDLEVRPGEVVALLGPNGAGKTTTLRTLIGELPPLDGTVWFDGIPTTSTLHHRASSGLAYVPENRAVFMRLTVRENLRVGRADLEKAVSLFPVLGERLEQTAGTLSGGEQQMLTLGRALARDPRLLLADELSLGLAPLIVEALLETVRKVSDEQGTGVLLVEQHVKQALKIADRVYVLRRGEIVMSGTSAHVGPRLKDAYLTETALPEPTDK